MGRPARLVIYLWAAFALLAITPLCSQASEHSLLREFADNPLAALYKLAYPENPSSTLDRPKCVLELDGSIQSVEANLTRILSEVQTVMVLITSKHDTASYPATKKYFDATRRLCNEDHQENEEFSDGFDTDEDETHRAIVAAQHYQFAQLSFDDTPEMIWRWWIWKVPIVAFVTASTSDVRPYDVRFWKIAWSIPSKERFIHIVGERVWLNIIPWDSRLAPGEAWNRSTILLALFFGKIYKVLDPIPNWLLTILASVLGSFLVTLLHRGSTPETYPTPPRSSATQPSAARHKRPPKS